MDPSELHSYLGMHSWKEFLIPFLLPFEGSYSQSKKMINILIVRPLQTEEEICVVTPTEVTGHCLILFASIKRSVVSISPFGFQSSWIVPRTFYTFQSTVYPAGPSLTPATHPPKNPLFYFLALLLSGCLTMLSPALTTLLFYLLPSSLFSPPLDSLALTMSSLPFLSVLISSLGVYSYQNKIFPVKEGPVKQFLYFGPHLY